MFTINFHKKIFSEGKNPERINFFFAFIIIFILYLLLESKANKSKKYIPAFNGKFLFLFCTHSWIFLNDFDSVVPQKRLNSIYFKQWVFFTSGKSMKHEQNTS